MTVMTKEPTPQGDSNGPDKDLEDERDHPFFADPAEATAENYPRLRNISAGYMFSRIARPLEPAPPEYVTLPPWGGISDAERLVAIAKWNLLWESAQFRRRYFDDDELPPEVAQIADQGDVNVTFIPRTATRYYEYAPLYHLVSPSQADGTACLSSVPGSGPTRRTSISRTVTCQRTARPQPGLLDPAGHQCDGGHPPRLPGSRR